MESKQQQQQQQQQEEKVMILRTAIKQLIDEDKERCNDHRLLSNLLSQVDTLEIENRTTEEEPSQVLVHDEQGRTRHEEIIKELRKVKRQNLITHCLLSAIFVLTVTWQLSEVSLILKVKESINHPVRSIGQMLTGMFKKPPTLVPLSAAKQEDDNKPKQRQNTIIQTSIPGIAIPKLPLLDLPSLDFDFDRE